MRQFFLTCPPKAIRRTVSGTLPLEIRQTLSSKSAAPPATSTIAAIADAFPLPWSHYVRFLSVRNPTALTKEQFLAHEIAHSRRLLEERLGGRGGPPRPRPGRSAGKTLSP